MTEPPPPVPEPDPNRPVEVPCTYTDRAVRYTSLDQFDYFREVINWWYSQETNVRIDEDDPDGLRIRWYWGYYLPFGHFLYIAGSELFSCTEAQLRHFLRPHPEWPQDLSTVFGYPADFVPPEGA